ncbi:MAG TPA: GW dipeptide domain-containing protein [Lentimicrobium sp.]|nr:GW dipeptide domain-containing protein [Lentimicrobium sp.]
MRKFILYFFSLILIVSAGCQRKAKEEAQQLPEGMHAVNVVDVKQTSQYTYFQVFENGNKFWIATNKLDAKEGDVVYYTQAFEMKDFKSRELNRTFESIMFVNDASLTYEKPQPQSPGKLNPREIQNLEFAKAPNGITIEELYAGKEKYNGKEVAIRGMIVKYNRNIMGKNWAHIQDGTKHNESFDLTVTTNDSLTEGKIAVFKGKITLDKDFGYGYKYDVIMEDAKTSEVEDTSVDL